MKKCAKLFLTAALALCWTPVFAQTAEKITNPQPVGEPTPPAVVTSVRSADARAEPDDSEVITVETGIVSIPVRVFDRNGKFIAGLTKEKFSVFEDGVEQEIEYFSNEQEPFTVALVLDMSYSAKFRAEEIQAAALAFIEQLRPADRVTVISFDQEVYVQCEPTSDRRVLREAIRRTKISDGTSLYEALALVMNDRLKKIKGRKAVVLFSDGVDTTSRAATDADNLRDALELDALIYPIEYDTFREVQAMRNRLLNRAKTRPGAIINEESGRGTTAEEYRRAAIYLEELAGRTGGRVYKAGTLANLRAAFTRIASELREYYSLGYYPKTEAADGRKYSLKVRVRHEGARVKTRSGYSGKAGN